MLLFFSSFSKWIFSFYPSTERTVCFQLGRAPFKAYVTVVPRRNCSVAAVAGQRDLQVTTQARDGGKTKPRFDVNLLIAEVNSP